VLPGCGADWPTPWQPQELALGLVRIDWVFRLPVELRLAVSKRRSTFSESTSA
jgi:hypothetical protein